MRGPGDLAAEASPDAGAADSAFTTGIPVRARRRAGAGPGHGPAPGDRRTRGRTALRPTRPVRRWSLPGLAAGRQEQRAGGGLVAARVDGEPLAVHALAVDVAG